MELLVYVKHQTGPVSGDDWQKQWSIRDDRNSNGDVDKNSPSPFPLTLPILDQTLDILRVN